MTTADSNDLLQDGNGMDESLVVHHETPLPGASIAGMPQPPAHAKPATRRDHLWVLAVIAGFALFDVWESWTQVGNKSGFAHGTGWTLTVIVEAYACYALFGWFGAPGVRSRRFAMWSALVVGILSLVGQGSSVLAARAVPPLWLQVFVKDLPVVVLALIAVLVHLRRLDREDAAEAVRRENAAARAAAAAAAAADERPALRAELEAARAAIEDAERARDAAQQEAAQATAKAEAAARKLAAQKPKRTRTAGPDAGKRTPSRAARDTTVPDDFDARTEALGVWLANPDISGKDLGEAVGMKERWGQLRKAEFAASAARPDAAAS